MDADAFLQGLLNGVVNGAVYLPLALGLTLIFGVLGVVNFAHADVFAVLVYVGVLLYQPGFQPYLLLPVLVTLGAVVGMLLHYGLIRPLQGRSQEAHIVITMGLSVLVQSGLLVLLGSEPRAIDTSIATSAVRIGPATVPTANIVAGALGLVTWILVERLVHASPFGAKLRVAAHDPDAAAVMGINAERMALAATAVGIAALGLAATTALPTTVAEPVLSQRFLIPIFSIVIIAGMGSVRGVAIGAVLYAVVESVSAAMFSPAMSNLLPLAVIALILLFRPEGLLAPRRS